MIDHYMAVDFSRPFPWPLLPHAYVAVDMFMILSGFVLAMTYEARFATIPAPARTILFFRLRIARLYPMYGLMTLVCFILCRLGWLTFLSPDTSFAALLANLLAIQTWIWPGSSLDGPRLVGQRRVGSKSSLPGVATRPLVTLTAARNCGDSGRYGRAAAQRDRIRVPVRCARTGRGQYHQRPAGARPLRE